MKEAVLFSGIMIGCFILTTGFFVQAALADDKAELMPIELDGTEWIIEVTSVNKEGAKKISEDTLLFKDKMFISKAYGKKGYTPTNYSLTISDDDVTSFGTMQIKDKETAFWRGSISGKKIEGSIHVQFPSGDNMTHQFTGQLLKGVLNRKSTPKPEIPKGE
ncbi:MAG: hypothetical protein KAS92_03870 [Candidatus Omnitrophica bacterium]|nr:hypothetical protein [Candidatus Omnitrophota bacterium]